MLAVLESKHESLLLSVDSSSPISPSNRLQRSETIVSIGVLVFMGASIKILVRILRAG